MGLFGSDKVVGVDLGNTSIKVVELRMGKQPRVTAYAEVAVEPRSLQKDGVEDLNTAAAALKQALKTAQPRAIKARNAYVSISETSVFRKILEVPKDVAPAELETVVRAAVVEFLPEDIASMELDFQPLGQPTGDHQQVMVVAVSRHAIEQYLELCKRAGLMVHAIDPKSSAMLRALLGTKPSAPTLIVNVGSENSSVSLCADRSVWAASSVPVGANMVRDPATGDIDPDTKDEKLKRLTSSLADELNHVAKFYANRVGGGAVAQTVQLCGGGSLLEGLDTLLATESGLKVSMAKPVFPAPQGFDRRYVGALGSALYPLFERVT